MLQRLAKGIDTISVAETSSFWRLCLLLQILTFPSKTALRRLQELIWRGRQEEAESASSRDTSTELTFSDLDNILTWNTSSSFENLTAAASRPRTPAKRRCGGDKETDDMAARMKAAANRIPTTVSSTVGMTDQSYLLLSPLEASYGLDKTSGKQTKSYLQ